MKHFDGKDELTNVCFYSKEVFAWDTSRCNSVYVHENPMTKNVAFDLLRCEIGCIIKAGGSNL